MFAGIPCASAPLGGDADRGTGFQYRIAGPERIHKCRPPTTVRGARVPCMMQPSPDRPIRPPRQERSLIEPRTAAGYPRAGTAFTRAFGRVVLAAARFRIAGALPELPKFVVCVAPHTSNWDFVIGYAAKMAVGVRAGWLGKHTLFRGPFGPIFRAMGGIPVDRSAASGVVGEAVRSFAENTELVLGVAPEGTRRKVDRWKTGFFHIAHEAGVPIVPVALDWGRSTVRIGPVFTPSGDVAADLRTLQAFFVHARGKVPGNAFPPHSRSSPGDSR